jgi:malonyl-CoA/methylmalonyl-CoA synthetase
MTETIMNVSNPYDGERQPGTVGLPCLGRAAPCRRAGGRGAAARPQRVRRLLGNPEATAEAFDPDGGFRTGDLGSFDERGYLRVEGRSRELIITGEQVTAFVVPTDPAAPPDREELLGFAAERLAGFKRPRVVHYVDALPRNALGKVLKHELRGRG